MTSQGFPGDDHRVANAVGVAILAGAVIVSAWIDASTPRPRACIREFISPPTLAAGDRCMSIEDIKRKQEKLHKDAAAADDAMKTAINAIKDELLGGIPSEAQVRAVATQIYWLQRVSYQIETLVDMQRKGE